jgi:predicted glutamine amidotransferase
MCRVFAYLGEPVSLDGPLFSAENSLINQTVSARLMSLLNIGGFGVAAWNSESVEPSRPYFYKTPAVPVFDRNLKALAEKVQATAAISHVRGVIYDPSETVGPQNLHPFRFPQAKVLLAQNGDLYDFGKMRYELLEYVPHEIARNIEGTTDTEWVYALVLSQLEDPWGPASAEQLAAAATKAIEIIRVIRDRLGLHTQSPVNLVISDGESIVATRFCFDYGWYPDDDSFFAGEREFDYTTLWYTVGDSFSEDEDGWSIRFGERQAAAIVASEPIGSDPSGWFEVPEYSMLVIERDEGNVTVDVRELNL